MTKTFKLIAALLLSSPAALNAATALLLPTLEKTAQGVVLGDGAANLTGLNALGINPAGLSVKNPEILTQLQPLLAGANATMFGAAVPIKFFNTTLAFSYLDVKTGAMDKRDALGQEQGSFKTQNTMMGAALSAFLPLPESLGANPLSVGVEAKRCRFQIDDMSASALAVDAGVRYTFVGLPLTLGASYLNSGKGATLYKEESKLPTSLVFSAAYQVNKDLMLTGGCSRQKAGGETEMSLGSELSMGKRFVLRGRYALRQASPSFGGEPQSFTAGFGVKMFGESTLDYAFKTTDAAAQVAGASGLHQVSLTFRFTPKPPKVTRVSTNGPRVIEEAE